MNRIKRFLYVRKRYDCIKMVLLLCIVMLFLIGYIVYTAISYAEYLSTPYELVCSVEKTDTEIRESENINAYSKQAVRTFEINEKTIGENCFKNCTSLEAVDLPATLSAVKSGCFSGCTALKEIDLPSSLTEVSSNMFYNCTSLEAVNFPDNLSIIYGGAFSGCSALTELNLPANLKTIGAYAFSDCISLKEIYFGSKLEKIANSAFEGAGLTGNIIIPSNVMTVESDAFLDCNNVEAYTILNPDLAMESRMGVVSTGNVDDLYMDIPTTFYSYRGSKAEFYANVHSAFTFSALDESCAKGDVNLDGKVNSADCVLLQKYLVQNTSLEDKQWECADITEDNSVNAMDMIALKRKVERGLTA